MGEGEVTDTDTLYQLKVGFMRVTSNFFRHTAGSGKYNETEQAEAIAAMKKMRGQYQVLTSDIIDRVLNKKDGSSSLTAGQQIAKKLKLYGFKNK